MLGLVPVVLSLLVLAAHFLRSGSPVLVLLVLIVLGLLLVPRRWAARVVQVTLLIGALEWVRTLLDLVFARLQAGTPMRRLVVILAVVALVTGGSALVFRAPRLRARYRPAVRRA